MWTTVFVGGLVVGFISEWRLSLFILGLSPILAVVGLVESKVRSWLIYYYIRDTCKYDALSARRLVHEQSAGSVRDGGKRSGRGHIVHTNCRRVWRRRQGGRKVSINEIGQ